jgi:hypothetical protein
LLSMNHNDSTTGNWQRQAPIAIFLFLMQPTSSMPLNFIHLFNISHCVGSIFSFPTLFLACRFYCLNNCHLCSTITHNPCCYHVQMILTVSCTLPEYYYYYPENI